MPTCSKIRTPCATVGNPPAAPAIYNRYRPDSELRPQSHGDRALPDGHQPPFDTRARAAAARPAATPHRSYLTDTDASAPAQYASPQSPHTSHDTQLFIQVTSRLKNRHNDTPTERFSATGIHRALASTASSIVPCRHRSGLEIGLPGTGISSRPVRRGNGRGP